MSKPLTRAQLLALEPRYTIGGLFESGRLGNADECALEEIKATREAFHRWLNPGRGWMTPRYGETEPVVPRQLGNARAWRDYKAWRQRWSKRIVPASPSVPWGLTVADVTTMLVTEPVNFNDVAPLTGMSALALVELFISSVRDYGVPPPVPAGDLQTWLWDDAKQTGAYRSARIPTAAQAARRAKIRARVQRHRAKKASS